MLPIPKWMKVLNYLYINRFNYNYVTKVSTETNISIAYTFRLINLLIKKELIIDIDNNPKDTRNRYISLTTKGEVLALDCNNLILKRNELMN